VSESFIIQVMELSIPPVFSTKKIANYQEYGALAETGVVSFYAFKQATVSVL